MRNFACLQVSRTLVTSFARIMLLFVLYVECAAAEPLQTLEESEETALRRELERIRQTGDLLRAEAARTVLEALDMPKTSKEGRQVRSRRERGDRRVVNGVTTFRYSAQAAVLRGSDPETATAHCTGTLIGCDKILTAAHCIAENPDPTNYLAYFQHLGFVKVSEITWPREEYKFPYADLAILTLSQPVAGIAPIAINQSASPIRGKIATIVGYGRTGGTRRDPGIKRDGSIKFGACLPKRADKKLLCWNFDADIVTEANTCQGDSGGGVFVLDKTVQRLVGIASGGEGEGCLKEQSYNTDVFEWRDWITEAARASLSDQTCGVSPRIDAPEGFVSHDVTLSKSQSEVRISVNVADDTGSLHVAMNGEEKAQSGNDFDLFVFEGATATSSPACAQSGRGQFAFCEIPNPKKGQWTIVVRRKKGEGLAQVVVAKMPRRD